MNDEDIEFYAELHEKQKIKRLSNKVDSTLLLIQNNIKFESKIMEFI